MTSRKSFFSVTLVLLTMILTSCSQLTQKRVEVTSQVGGEYRDTDSKFIFDACFKKTLTNNKFNELLSKGAKVITSQNFQFAIDYFDVDGEQYEGICVGQTYVLEGRKSLFEK